MAILLVLITLAAACGAKSESNESEAFGGRVYRRKTGNDIDTGTTLPGSTPTTAKRNYEPTVQPLNCPTDRDSYNRLTVDCVQLIVPEDRTNPASNKIFIAVMHIHSTSKTPAPDPIMYLEGGPGGSAIAGVDHWTTPVSPLLANRDVYLLDQRGTGYSQPRLNCDRAFVNSPHMPLDDHTAQSAKCLADLRADGIKPEFYNTAESAHDVADLREALKIKQWNLFGISYGTRLALVTMQLYPEGIRSVVIDSVLPPVYANLISQPPSTANRALEELFNGCASTPSCAGRYPNLRGALYGTIDRLNASPIEFSTYDPIKGDDVILKYSGNDFMLELFQAMYSSDIIRDLPRAINLASQGQIDDSLNLLEGYGAYERKKKDDTHYRPQQSRRRPLLTDGLYDAVECAEDAPVLTHDAIDASMLGLPKELISSMGKGSHLLLDDCAQWNMPAKPLQEVVSPIYTLVLAGTYDPITPPDWSQHAASLLPNGQFKTTIGSGHAVYYSGDCPKQMVTQYFDNPTAPAIDCPGAVPDFTTG